MPGRQRRARRAALVLGGSLVLGGCGETRTGVTTSQESAPVDSSQSSTPFGCVESDDVVDHPLYPEWAHSGAYLWIGAAADMVIRDVSISYDDRPGSAPWYVEVPAPSGHGTLEYTWEFGRDALTEAMQRGESLLIVSNTTPGPSDAAGTPAAGVYANANGDLQPVSDICDTSGYGAIFTAVAQTYGGRARTAWDFLELVAGAPEGDERRIFNDLLTYFESTALDDGVAWADLPPDRRVLDARFGVGIPADVAERYHLAVVWVEIPDAWSSSPLAMCSRVPDGLGPHCILLAAPGVVVGDAGRPHSPLHVVVPRDAEGQVEITISDPTTVPATVVGVVGAVSASAWSDSTVTVGLSPTEEFAVMAVDEVLAAVQVGDADVFTLESAPSPAPAAG